MKILRAQKTIPGLALNRAYNFKSFLALKVFRITIFQGDQICLQKFNLSFQLFAIFFKILIIFADLVLDKSDKNEDWSQIEVSTRKLCGPMIYPLLVLLSEKIIPELKFVATAMTVGRVKFLPAV